MNVFVARQPIFDREQAVYGYELLFRSGWDNIFRHPDQDQASAQVIANSLMAMDFDAITDGKKAFINCTRDALIKRYPTMLAREAAVVELLEQIEPDDEVLAACRALKAAGYTIALDDFVYRDTSRPLLELADIVKVDFTITPVEEQRDLVHRCARPGVAMLAEKVETREEFERALAMGYRYFQGYFFSRPVVLGGRDIPPAKWSRLELLREINRPDLDYGNLERVLQRDVALSYKLLRYINSCAFAFRTAINSLKHALALLGETEVKKWASLIALASMGEDKPSELFVTAVVRGRFGESLAPGAALADRGTDLFLMGLFSVIDALMDRPLAEVLAAIPLSEDIKLGLLGQGGRFQAVHQLVLAYERGDWAEASRRSAELALDEADIPPRYLASVEWARRALQEGVQKAA